MSIYKRARGPHRYHCAEISLFDDDTNCDSSPPVHEISFDEGRLANVSEIEESCDARNRRRVPCDLQSLRGHLFCDILDVGKVESNSPGNKRSKFWETDLAREFFGAVANESAEDAVDDMIAVLQRAYKDPKMHRNFLQIVEGNDTYDLLTADEKYRLYIKCIYIHHALDVIKDTIESGEHFDFEACCDATAEFFVDLVPTKYRVDGAIIAEWYWDFQKGRVFSNPKAKLQKDISVLYDIWFSQSSDERTKFLQYVIENCLPKDVGKQVYHCCYEYFLESFAASIERGPSVSDASHGIIPKYDLSNVDATVFGLWMDHALTEYILAQY